MRLVLVVSLAVALSPAAFAEDPARALESKIARVTVYEDRALVTRAAKTSLPQGTSRLAFEHLPPGLDPASIRARCGSARVLGVDVEPVHLAHEGREDLARAVGAHDVAKRKVASAEMELAEAKDRWELYRSIRAKGVEGGERALGGGGAVDVKSLKDLIELVGAQGAKARQDVLSATDGLDVAKADEDAARRRVDELRTGRDRTESRVLVTLEADATGDATVTVQYMIGGASWQPVYDLRVDEGFGAASLGLSAVVVQKTGEAWTDVALELTTAQPSAGAAPPEPQPWRVWLPSRDRGEAGFAAPAAPPAPAAKRSMRPAVADKLKADDDAVALALDAKDENFAAQVRRTGLVVAFQSQLTESIASDGQPSRVALARFDMKPDVRWTAFPRATDKVFVTAKMTNTTNVALPAGETRVFVGVDYVGPFALKDWGVAKEIDVGLGVDRDVEVERERLKDERSTEGLFSKDTVHTQSFRLSVKNHRDRDIAVRLIDQLPVSNDEDLTVKVTEKSRDFATLPDRDAETNKARGVLEWRFPLAAKTNEDVRFAFEVRHPKSKDVYGLGE
jgi:uncharacterized protein (TIGR02231 family)